MAGASSNATSSVPVTSKAASPAATTVPTVASGSAGLTKTTTGGQLQVTGAANMMSANGGVALFGLLLAAVVLF